MSLIERLHLNANSLDLNLNLKDFILPIAKSNEEKLKEYLPSNIIHEMKDIPIPFNNLVDTPVWGLTSSGKFFIKLANWLAHKIPCNNKKWDYGWI